MAKFLGLRKADPRKLARSVPFGQFVVEIPPHPVASPAPDLTWPMDHNDQAGDCVVAGLDHALQAFADAFGLDRRNWTDTELLTLYQTQNPDFRSWADGGTWRDNGMYIQQFLEYLVSIGIVLAFGRVDHTNADELKAATWLGVAIVTGETLQEAQDTGRTWDYTPGSPDWGGHCTVTVGWEGMPDNDEIVSWGALYEMTRRFVTTRVDEAWFVLTRAHVDHPGFRAGYDLPGFAKAVADLTDGKVVVPVTPVPTPTPTPAPPPFSWLKTWWHAFTAWLRKHR